MHGGNDADLDEAVEVFGEKNLACSMWKRKLCGVAVRGNCKWSAQTGWAVARGFGGAEGVEGEVVGPIADGMEANLEAGGGAGRGEAVEVGLGEAGEAAVAGVIGLGGGEGGSAGAEGAVHEALELGEVEEGVVGGVAGALMLEGVEGEGDVAPLGDAEGVGTGEDFAVEEDTVRAGRAGGDCGTWCGGKDGGAEEEWVREHVRSGSGGFKEGLLVEEVGGVEDGEEEAAEGELAAGGVVPLGEGVDAAAGAAAAEGYGGNTEREGDVGVGGANAGLGAEAEMAVDGADGLEEGGIGTEFGGGAAA